MPNALTGSRKLRRRASKGVVLNFPARTRLFDGHQAPRYVYLLRSGQVRISRGSEAIVDYLGRGDFFGEQSLLSPGATGQIAETLSPVKVAVFRKSELVDCLRRDRRFALRLLRSLALRLNRTEQMIHAFVTDPAERRLARLLLRFVPASTVSGWVRLRFSPSNAELAKTVGTTRWRIAHFMRHFQDLGWLARRPGLWAHCEGLREFLKVGQGSDRRSSVETRRHVRGSFS